MSRFADVRATATVDLGPCECPGAPHESDTAEVRAEFSSSETARIAAASTTDEAAIAAVLAEFVPSWNLLGPNGEPWPPSADSLLALKAPTLSAIAEAISAGVLRSSELPNASGAPSAASSPGSASPTPMRTRTPTT